MSEKLWAPNFMESVRRVRSWLWKFEDGHTFAPGSMPSDPILGEDIRGALFWDQGGTGQADMLVAPIKNATDAMAFVQIPTVPINSGLMPVFNVRDYGAVGDGATNDQPAVQAAIDACADAGGGTVYVPEGTYRVAVHATVANVAIYLPSTVWLRGAGRASTTLQLADGADASVVAFAYDADDMAVSDLTIDGNRTNQSVDVHGLRFHGNARTYAGRLIVKECRRYGLGVGYTVETQIPWRDSIVEDVEIFNIGHDAVGDGFDGKRSERCTIRRLSVHDCIANGLDVRGNHTTISDVHVADCGGVGFSQRMSAYDPPDAGVSLRESRHLFAQNITVEGCGSHGFWIEAVEGDAAWFTDEWFGRAFLSNAIARGNGGRGFYLAGGDGRCFYHLTHCLAEGNTSHGFQLNANNHDDTRGKLVNCTSRNNGVNGFDLTAANGEGDILVACEAAGNVLGFSVGGSRHTLIGCRADGNSSDGIRLGGTDCFVIGGSVETNSAIAVRVNGTDRNTVHDLAIKTTSGTGISIVAGADDTRIRHNNLSGVGGTKVIDAGTNTVFADNIGYVGKELTATRTVTLGINNTWTNQPAAATEFIGASTTWRIPINLENASQVRLVAGITTVGATGAKIYLEYSTTAGGTYAALGTSAVEVTIDNTGTRDSGWIDLAAGAKVSEIWVKVMGSGGDATADPIIRTLIMQVR